MTKIQLYIASTIDGYIARENGSLDWLMEIPNPKKIDHGYQNFINGISTVIMGRKTYDEIIGFGIEWPYDNCKTYIITNSKEFKVNTPNTFIINALNIDIIKQFKQESTNNIWIVGGGNLISQFLNYSAIDEMILSIIPRILGKGIKLFPDSPKETKFLLMNSEAFETGIVNLTYKLIR